MPDISLNRISRLIEEVYLAGFDQSRWQNFVDTLAATYPGAGVALVGHDSESHEDLGEITAGHAPEFIDSFRRYYSALNPWFAHLAHVPVGVALNSDELLPRDAIKRTEFYHDWLRPQGDMVGGYGSVVHSDGRRFLMFNLTMADREMAHYGDELQMLCAELGPHLRNAVGLLRRSVGADLGNTSGHSFEMTPSPVFVIDAAGTVSSANTRADELRLGGDIVIGGIGAPLTFRDPLANVRFSRSLQALLMRNYSGISAPFPVYGQSSRREYLVTVAPYVPDLQVEEGPFRFLVDDRPVAVVLLTPTPGPDPTALDASLRARGLTGAERTLALAIHGGRSLQAYAEDRQLSIHTVRNQLRGVYDKLDVRRQSELAVLMGRLAGTDRRP